MRRATIGFATIFVAMAASIAAADGRVSADATQKDPGSGMVYGEGHAFWLTAPDGWVLDNRAGVDQGLYAVFYPAGSSWADAPAVMYANTAMRDTTNQESLESFIAGDFEEAKSKSPHLRMVRSAGIVTADGKHAEVRVFTGDKWGNIEEVAYIPEHRVFVLLTLTSKTRGAFARSVSAFESLVKSYDFFTEDVIENR